MHRDAAFRWPGFPGPEDIQIDNERERAFIASNNRRGDEARGAIHIFDPADPLNDSAWRDRTKGAPEAFQPIGIDYYSDDEVSRLFVVNAANASVEMFDVKEDGDLIHLETFAERRLTSPNNVVAVGRRSFYVSNDDKSGRQSITASLRFLMRSAAGQVLYTDGTIWRVAADELYFPNGLAVSNEGDRLFIAETAANALRIYARSAESGVLSNEAKVPLEAAPDNLTIDDAGNVWIAALPRPLSIAFQKASGNMKAPSAVLRLNENGDLQPVYRDDGSELSASSVAARAKGQLLIGAQFEDKFLLCDLPDAAL